MIREPGKLFGNGGIAAIASHRGRTSAFIFHAFLFSTVDGAWLFSALATWKEMPLNLTGRDTMVGYFEPAFRFPKNTSGINGDLL
jgi:hypothetical protein